MAKFLTLESGMTRTIKILHWTPRILGIAAILFISLFALDAFGSDTSLGEQLLGFLIHMVPSFILLFLLLIAWKWEMVGGICFLSIGLVMTPMVYRMNYDMNDSVWMSMGIVASITLPFVIIGILFVASDIQKKKTLTIK